MPAGETGSEVGGAVSAPPGAKKGAGSYSPRPIVALGRGSQRGQHLLLKCKQKCVCDDGDAAAPPADQPNTTMVRGGVSIRESKDACDLVVWTASSQNTGHLVLQPKGYGYETYAPSQNDREYTLERENSKRHRSPHRALRSSAPASLEDEKRATASSTLH